MVDGIWVGIVFIIISALILVVYAIRLKNKREEDAREQSRDQDKYVSMYPLRTVYDEQQRRYRYEVISDTSNGRKIDGHPLRTPQDWERWSVYDHQATDASGTVQNCIKSLSSAYCDDPDGTLVLAKRKYKEYEELCTRYGMWNNLIKDHMVYHTKSNGNTIRRRERIGINK